MTVAKGLEGVVAVTSEVSSIIDGVLTYRGINIDELAEKAGFEEVILLLWNGRLPKREELEQLQKDLDENASIPEQVLNALKEYPKDVHPMAVLRTAVSQLAVYDPEADDNSAEANRRKAIRLTAKIPTIITSFYRLRSGLEPVAPRPGQGFARNFLYMLNGKDPEEVAVKAFDKALILHADHELNASTFAARVTTATLSDMYSAITSAIGTLEGSPARRRQRARDGHAEGNRHDGPGGILHPGKAGPEGKDHGLRTPGLQGRRSPGEASAGDVPPAGRAHRRHQMV